MIRILLACLGFGTMLTVQLRPSDAGTVPIVASAPVAPVTVRVALEVRWWPERPAQGAVVRFVVPAEGVEELSGTFGDAPLRFARRADGALLAVGGVPVDAAAAVPLALVARAADGTVTPLRRDVPVAPARFRLEKLTVAPRFGRAPDSALAARTAREAAQARAVSEQAVETPRLWGGAWVRPRPGRITSGFGHGREFNGRVQSRHMGTDFAGAIGTPVRAANCGVVALVADFYLAGTAIYIDHGAGLVSGYFHLSQADVARGDTVAAGEMVGRVGNSGRVTGPHLHWIIRSNGVTVNPMTVFTLDSAAVKPAASCSGAGYEL